MSEPRKLHLKKPPERPSLTSLARTVASGGRRPVIPPEKRHMPGASPAAGGRSRRGPGRGVVFAVFGAIVTAAAVFGFLRYLDEKRTAVRREHYALRNEQDRAEALYAKFPPLVDRVRTIEAEAAEAETAASEAVQFITGRSFSEHTTPRRPPKRAPAAAGPTAAASTPPAAEPPAPGVEPPPEREVVDGREQPDGVESLADLERRRQMEEEARQGVRRPPPDAPAPAPPTNPPPESAPEPERPPEPEREAPEVVRIAVDIARLAGEIRGHRTGIETLREEAETTGNAVMRARTSGDAARLTGRMQELLAQAENTAGLAASALDQTRSASVRVIALRDAESQTRRQRDEEERRRQAEEDLKALIEQEKARAGELHKGARKLIRAYDFTQALAEMETAIRDMRTEEGKKALGLVADRYRRLVGMKETLVRRLNEKPFKWGWGSGAAAKDVQGADTDGVDVAGRRVPWVEVSLPQMVKFVDHYQTDATERMSTRADLALALAILLDEADRRVEAAEYVRRAREASEYGQAETRRLMPDY